MKLVTNKFKSGGLHEKHVVATWNLGDHLSICLQTQGNQEKPVSRWPVAGPSEYRLLASSPASKVETKYMCDVFHWLLCQAGTQTPACCSVDTHYVSLQCIDHLHVLVVQHYNYVKWSKTQSLHNINLLQLTTCTSQASHNYHLNLSIFCVRKENQQDATI